MDSDLTMTVCEVRKEPHWAVVCHCAIHLIASVNGTPYRGAVNNLHCCSVHSGGTGKIQVWHRTVRGGWAGYGPQWGSGSTLRPTKGALSDLLEERKAMRKAWNEWWQATEDNERI